MSGKATISSFNIKAAQDPLNTEGYYPVKLHKIVIAQSLHAKMKAGYTMSEYIKLELQSLVDQLVENIKEYDRMLSSKVFTEEEFTQCKQKLAEIHAAIKEKGEAAGYSMNNIFPSFPNESPARLQE